MNMGKQVKFEPNIVQNKVENTIAIQERIVRAKYYQYEEPMPKIQWRMLKGDTLMSDETLLSIKPKPYNPSRRERQKTMKWN